MSSGVGLVVAEQPADLLTWASYRRIVFIPSFLYIEISTVNILDLIATNRASYNSFQCKKKRYHKMCGKRRGIFPIIFCVRYVPIIIVIVIVIVIIVVLLLL